MVKRFNSWLFEQVPNSQLIVFRMLFGFLLAAEGFGAILTGWVRNVFITPEFTFTFIGFEWLKPLPGNGMLWYYAVLGVLGLMVMTGFRYKIAMASYAVMWAAVYWMQKSSYNNHYYLLVWLNFIMVALPAHRSYSLDVRWFGMKNQQHCQRWHLWIFIFLMGIMYVYGGIAKINPYWIAGNPMDAILSSKQYLPLIGVPLKPILTNTFFHYFISWGGLFFDLTIIFWLLWKKSRPIAMLAAVGFHLFNSIILQVGIFPFMGIGFLVFFVHPNWINRKLLTRHIPCTKGDHPIKAQLLWQPVLQLVLPLFILVHVLLPIRHHFLNSYVTWSEAGHKMSWRMMLRIKQGSVQYKIKPGPNEKYTWHKPVNHLSEKQYRAVVGHPDMIWQYAQRLKESYQLKGYTDVEIYASSRVSLNGLGYKLFIDPTVNLAAVDWNYWGNNDWVMPMPYSHWFYEGAEATP